RARPHGRRLRLLRHRLPALPHELIDRRHESPLARQALTEAKTLTLYLNCPRLSIDARTRPWGLVSPRDCSLPGLGHRSVVVEHPKVRVLNRDNHLWRSLFGARSQKFDTRIRVQPRSGRDEAADDDVFLQPLELVHLTADGGLGQHPRGLLER